MSEVKTVVRRGRPIVASSARQVRLEIRAQKVVQGLSVDRGRPTNTQSARQIKLAEKAAKIAAGIEIKRGAPKKVKAEEVKAEAVSE
jgi:hypothetical protein